MQGAGCAARGAVPALPEPAPPSSARALYDALTAPSVRPWALEGTGRFRVHAGERKVRLDVTLLCERPDSLRFEADDFLGHFVFLAVLHRGELTSYSAPENLYARGPANADRMGVLLGVPLGPEELVSLVLGSPLFVRVADPSLRLSVAGDHHVLTVCDPSEVLCTTVRVDLRGRPEASLLVGALSPGGPVLRIRVEFGRYRSTEGAEFPFRIRVTDEHTGRFFQMDYEEILVNRALPRDLFTFEPPAGAERVTW